MVEMSGTWAGMVRTTGGSRVELERSGSWCGSELLRGGKQEVERT